MKITWFDETDSTQREAARNADNAAEGAVWAALFQTAGRGQQNNSWESEGGKNLTISVLLRPTWLPTEKQFYISKITSLGVYDFLKQHGIESTIKWPNDSYVNDKKIAGTLIENHLGGNALSLSILGIGLNVNQEIFKSNAPNPTSMILENGKTIELKTALLDLRSSIFKWYDCLKNGGFKEIDTNYIKNFYRFEEWHWFEKQGKRFFGKITHVKPNGEIAIEDESGKQSTFAFKEVSFIL